MKAITFLPILTALTLGILLPACVSRPASPAQAPTPLLAMRGADISSLPQYEASGAGYREGGEPKPLLSILGDNGVNWVRLRLWVDPSGHGNWCDLEGTVAMAKRVKAAGLSLLLDIHYSDWWADPGQQAKPGSWAALPYGELVAAVHDYTADSLRAFVAAGAPPDMVQVGNEITNGMLWPEGRIRYGADYSGSWDGLAPLVGAGLDAVSEVLPGKPRMLHITTSAETKASLDWLGSAAERGLDFEVIGFSYYSLWNGTDLDRLSQTLSAVAKAADEDICLVETFYPWTLSWANDGERNVFGMESQLIPGYPASADGQREYLRELIRRVAALPDGRGLGVFWWEPGLISAPGMGSSQENLGWFDFGGNYNGTSRAFLGE